MVYCWLARVRVFLTEALGIRAGSAGCGPWFLAMVTLAPLLAPPTNATHTESGRSVQLLASWTDVTK